MHRAIPGSELVMVRPAGHPGFLESGREYDGAIGDFAARCLACATPAGGRMRPRGSA